MKVCLDARGNHFGGVYTYTYSMLRSLPRADPGIEYLLLLDQYQVDEGRLPVSDIACEVTPVMSPLRMVAWNNFELPRFLGREKVDLYHGFKHFGLRYPTQYACKMIWTLRTASWWLLPELFSIKERVFWSNYYKLGARKLDRVICVAHADKDAFVQAVGVSPDRVSVTQLAADERFKRITDEKILCVTKRKFNLPDNFILFVGTIYPFKNVETILSVFANTAERMKLPYKLVIAGGQSPAYGPEYRNTLEQQASSLGISDRVIWLGPVFDELPALYTLADLLLFPSRFEAFAKPPLEAMACGTPVVGSNAAGLPEVIGSAGLMRAPDDVNGLTNDVICVLTDSDLQQTLVSKGQEQASRFSWDRCARETVFIYKSVLK